MLLSTKVSIGMSIWLLMAPEIHNIDMAYPRITEGLSSRHCGSVTPSPQEVTGIVVQGPCFPASLGTFVNTSETLKPNN